MSTKPVVSFRLARDLHDALCRIARMRRRSPGETAADLLVEKIKEEEFSFVEFRPTVLGRLPHVKGTSLAVWEIVLVGRELGMDADRAAHHLGWPPERVEAVFAYAEAHPEDVDPLVERVASTTAEDLRRIVPGLREIAAE